MRYIDADAFKQKLADKDIFFPALYKNELNEMPTADVVPKSEVARLRADINLLQMEKAVLIKRRDELLQSYAREIFEEIYEDCFDQFGYINYEALAELKKKYTEGE